jgi:very-short-patch-repair endonuclease
MNMCLNCDKEIISRDKRKTFCNHSCSATYNNKKRGKKTDEQKNNIRESVIKNLGFTVDEWCKNKIGVCLNCNKNFEKRNKKTIYCNRQCKSKHESNKPESKERISKLFSKLTKERHDNGDERITWKTRNKLKPSYPEQLTIDFFNKIQIKFERELKVGKYFIDFSFLDKKIALEIDGRTHDDINVMEKDKIKTIFLESLGWKVYRIKWSNDSKHYERLKAFIVQMEEQ